MNHTILTIELINISPNFFKDTQFFRKKIYGQMDFLKIAQLSSTIIKVD